jgi:lambda repressor-like predicted transcriptional regulator
MGPNKDKDSSLIIAELKKQNETLQDIITKMQAQINSLQQTVQSFLQQLPHFFSLMAPGTSLSKTQTDGDNSDQN